MNSIFLTNVILNLFQNLNLKNEMLKQVQHDILYSLQLNTKNISKKMATHEN